MAGRVPGVRSYLDQLVRWNGLATERRTVIAGALDAAEQQTGKQRRDVLNAQRNKWDRDVTGAKDPARVKAMSAAIKVLAKATK